MLMCMHGEKQKTLTCWEAVGVPWSALIRWHEYTIHIHMYIHTHIHTYIRYVQVGCIDILPLVYHDTAIYCVIQSSAN